MIRVSDLIQLEEIKKWKQGEIILISAPTGSGKSTLIKTYLNGYARTHNQKILLLSNRDLLKEQNKVELVKDTDIISLINYQKIENDLLFNKQIPYYDFIVADESHYFFTDSVFNNKTDLIFYWLLKNNNSTRIFLSATSYILEKYFKQNDIKYINYEIQPDYDYIENFYFYNDDKVLKKMLIDLPENEKAIYFTTVEKAYNTSKEFKNTKFICSEHNITHKKYSDKDIKNQIIENEKFDCQILCTTTTLDNGVNIKDVQVKHIVIDHLDLDTIQQCFGRRRIESDEETVNIYIRNRSPLSLSGSLSILLKEKNQIDFFIEHGEVEFARKYSKRKYSDMIDTIPNNKGTGTCLKLNEIKHFKFEYDIKIIESMINELDGFIEWVIDRFNIVRYKTLDNEFDKLTIQDKLDKIIEQKMFKPDQNEFKEFLLTELINAPKANHGSIGLKTINSMLDEYKLNYIVSSKKETEGELKGKRYWIISKL